MPTTKNTIYAVEVGADSGASVICEAVHSGLTTCRIPGLPRFFHWTPNGSPDQHIQTDAKLTEVDQRCRKLVLRKSPVERISGFFASNSAMHPMARAQKIIYEPSDGKGEDVTEANVYYEVKFPSWPSLDLQLPRFWDFRHRDLTSSDSLAKGNYDSVILHTGICLFSESLLRSLRESYGPHCCSNAIKVDDELDRLGAASLSLYEVEAISRLSSGVAVFAAMVYNHLRHKVGDPCEKITVSLDIPTVQYYDTAFRALADGAWSCEQAIRWTSIIRDRAQMLGQHIEDQICQTLLGLGIDPHFASAITIERTNGMQSLEHHCEALLADKISMEVEALLRLLTSNATTGWAKYLEASYENSPTTFADISNHSYAVSLLKSVLCPDDQLQSSMHDSVLRLSPGERHLIVCVDSSAERRTFFRATRTVKELRRQDDIASQRTTLLGAYPLETFISTDGVGSSTLYTHDPGNYVRFKNG